uniref:Tudor domain-containing protein n=1 Tax=Angiostrongylus cantonensis TaxID=6313 RepID=A0A0K0D1W4_ANGCA
MLDLLCNNPWFINFTFSKLPFFKVSSQDSGRATGGLASSLSPMDEAGDVLPMYEFEIPNTLVGLVIGIKGKTIKELSTRTDVRMLIRQHHIPEKIDTHQICQVRGKREQINRCLQMLRRRFPPARFPELNLQPVLPPPIPSHFFDSITYHPTWLTLPDEIPCEVVCSSVIDPGHFFVQQPTHPSFSSLSHLDMYMLRLYSQASDIPDLPKPCQNGLLCAAPVLGAWFRAVTVNYNIETDEVMLRFVDYGGYTLLPRSELRQIRHLNSLFSLVFYRTDLMSLPFQAVECYLAHVQPVDGTWQWGEDALKFFQKLCMGKVINATVVGVSVNDKVPMVELTVPSEDGKLLRVDKELMNSGFAKASDPSKVQKVSTSRSRSMVTHSAPVVAAV